MNDQTISHTFQDNNMAQILKSTQLSVDYITFSIFHPIQKLFQFHNLDNNLNNIDHLLSNKLNNNITSPSSSSSDQLHCNSNRIHNGLSLDDNTTSLSFNSALGVRDVHGSASYSPAGNSSCNSLLDEHRMLDGNPSINESNLLLDNEIDQCLDLSNNQKVNSAGASSPPSSEAPALDDSDFSSLYNFLYLNSISQRYVSMMKKPDRLYDGFKTYNVRYNEKIYPITIFHPKYAYLPPLQMVVQHPDTDILNFIKVQMDKLRYHISQVEYSFDFTDLDPHSVHRFLRSSLWMKNARTEIPILYDNTTYFNNARASNTSGMRSYVKTFDGTLFARFEVTLKRKALRKMEVESIEDLINIEVERITSYFEFKKIDFHSFRTHLNKLNYNEHEIDSITTSIHSTLHEHGIHKANREVKELTNRSFLERHRFHYEFMDSMHGKSFLNGDVAVFNPACMDL